MSDMSKEEILASFGFESPSKTNATSSHPPIQPADEWPTVQIDWDTLHDQQTQKQQHDQSMAHSDSDSSDDDQPTSQSNNQSINAMNQWKRDLHDDEWDDPSDSKPIANDQSNQPNQLEWNPSISQFSSVSWDNAQTFEHSIDSHDEGGLTEQSMNQSIDDLINQPIDDMTDQQKQALQVKIDASIKQTINPTVPRQRAAPENEPTNLPIDQSHNQSVDQSISNDEITPSDHLIEPPNQNALIDPDQYESSSKPSNQTDDPLAHLPASIRAMLIEGRDKVNEQYRTKPT